MTKRPSLLFSWPEHWANISRGSEQCLALNTCTGTFVFRVNCITKATNPPLCRTTWMAWRLLFVGWLLGSLTSQQHASVSQGRICSDNFIVLPHWDRSCRSNFPSHPVTVYWHRADQSQHWPYNSSRQGNHWSANFYLTGMTRPRKNPGASRIRTRDLSLSRRTP